MNDQERAAGTVPSASSVATVADHYRESVYVRDSHRPSDCEAATLLMSDARIIWGDDSVERYDSEAEAEKAFNAFRYLNPSAQHDELLQEDSHELELADAIRTAEHMAQRMERIQSFSSLPLETGRPQFEVSTAETSPTFHGSMVEAMRKVDALKGSPLLRIYKHDGPTSAPVLMWFAGGLTVDGLKESL